MNVTERNRMDIAMAFVLVAIGGAIGAVLRYAVIVAFDGSDFPWAIFIVNIVGCILAAYFLFKGMDDMTKVLVITGIMGAFTTLSAFTNDTVGMLADQEYVRATVNVILNVGVCLLGAIVGRYLALAL